MWYKGVGVEKGGVKKIGEVVSFPAFEITHLIELHTPSFGGNNFFITRKSGVSKFFGYF